METSIDLKRIMTSQLPPKPGPPANGTAVKRVFGSGRRRISEKEKEDFCLQLSVMLQSGIPIHRALNSLVDQTRSHRLKQVLGILLADIQKGHSFAHALSLQGAIFDKLFVVTAEVGQESGRLPQVLGHLAQHIEKIGSLRRKFTQALVYPILVLSVACFTVSFLLVFIVPQFAEMFKSFQVELPSSTKFVLHLSDTLVSYGGYFVFIIFVLLFILWKSLSKPTVRQKIEDHLFQVPFIGDTLLKNYAARFCRTLGTLLEAQVSLIDALNTTQRIVTNSQLQREIGEITRQVKKGNTISSPVTGSKFFPPMVSQMIAVGEETDELDSMLLKVADYFERELDNRVETLSTVLEPVLILFLGLIVALVLVSMYLPMFDLVNVVGAGK